MRQRRIQRLEHLGPTGLGPARIVGPLGLELVGQGEHTAGALRNDVDDHATLIFRLRRDAPREREPTRPLDLEIPPDVVDFLTLSAHQEREGPADARIDRDAQYFLVAKRGTEHPFADHFNVQPGVEDALSGCIEAPGDTNMDWLLVVHCCLTPPRIASRARVVDATELRRDGRFFFRVVDAARSWARRSASRVSSRAVQRARCDSIQAAA